MSSSVFNPGACTGESLFLVTTHKLDSPIGTRQGLKEKDVDSYNISGKEDSTGLKEAQVVELLWVIGRLFTKRP
ncbi:uncharacterized protein G2W53_003678 [Senna tora]|uniref:Uncharacterized protein n=1 Tax=Senna tora TaxID=362788 RepID=A0A835CIM5_9FABA|nr:uncharacterized protein G2W53_003678 [Senna tora]